MPCLYVLLVILAIVVIVVIAVIAFYLLLWVIANVIVLLWNFILFVLYIPYWLWTKLALLLRPIDDWLWIIPEPILAWCIAGILISIPIAFVVSIWGLKRSYFRTMLAATIIPIALLSGIMLFSAKKDRKEFGISILERARQAYTERRYKESIADFKLARNVLGDSISYAIEKWKAQLAYFKTIGAADTITIEEVRQRSIQRAQDSAAIAEIFAEAGYDNYALQYCPDGERLKSVLYFRAGEQQIDKDTARLYYTLAIENQKAYLRSKFQEISHLEDIDLGKFYFARAKTYTEFSKFQELQKAKEDCDSALIFYKDYADALKCKQELSRKMSAMLQKLSQKRSSEE